MTTQTVAVGPTSPTNVLVQIEDLVLGVQRNRKERLLIVDSATFDIRQGEMLGLVGESGSGKTMVCRSLIGTLRRRGVLVFGGHILFDGIDLATASERAWRSVRGSIIGYVPQSSLTGPNPVMKVGAQLGEAIRLDQQEKHADVKKRALELLDTVQIRRPEVAFDQYPHQLSGGMKQRVMIACALAQHPQLIVADEPTTGLDVTVQAGIMKLLKSIQVEMNTSIVLVSHDLGLIDETCDRLVVMHAGTCVEYGTIPDVRSHPMHPYTLALENSRIDRATPGTELRTIKGIPPPVGGWSTGCRFAARCDFVQPDCIPGPSPQLLEVVPGHYSSCLHPEFLEVES
jgi:oligopeptide/dipeptide ABC transporter ATP-binding protein